MKDLDALIANLRRSIDEAPIKKAELVNKMGDTALELIKDHTPVRSGHLRDSIHKEETAPDVIKILSDCDYVVDIEEGHVRGSSFVQGRHMFQKGMGELETHTDSLVKDFYDSLKILGD